MEFIYACEEHIDEAMDEVINEKETFPVINEVIEKIDYTTEYVNDNTLAEGSRVTTVNGMAGYRSKAYLVTYSNGVEVSREFISSDYYAPMNTVVKVGTKKATTTEN